MQRLHSRIMVFLMLGAAINVAVAWGCALLVDTDETAFRPYYSEEAEPRWFFCVRESLGRTSVMSHRLLQVNNIPAHPIHQIGWSRVSLSPDPSWQRPKFPVIDMEVRYECAAGFPFRAFFGWRDYRSYAADGTVPNLNARMTVTPANPGWAIQARPTAVPPPGMDDLARGLLPLRPIPLGFILNTIFYAIACSFAVYHWRRIVRVRRRARGRCEWCGYDARMLSTSTCPECGRPALIEKSQRGRAFTAGMDTALCLCCGFFMAVAVAWMIAWDGGVRAISQRVAWPSELPSLWLAQRTDARGATKLRWAFDDEWADHCDDRDRAMERARRRGDPAEAARVESRFADERRNLLSERSRLAPVDALIVPAWSSRIEILGRPAEFESSSETAYGWPCRALSYGERIGMDIDDARDPAFAPGANGWYDALFVQAGRRLVVLPLRPIWEGLALNSALFAIPFLGVAPLWTRVSRHHKR